MRAVLDHLFFFVNATPPTAIYTLSLHDALPISRTKDEKAASGKASLNGEENYQFSARALIDRYHAMHFPLSWFVPNYGVQANNQQALSFFNEYALNQDVHPGFWHQSEVELPEKTDRKSVV